MKKEECVLKLPLGDAAKTFNLEDAVCSHGLFMMSPNRWDPLSQSLSRPLRVSLDDDDDDDSNPTSVNVTICQTQQDPHSLHVKVYESSSGLMPLSGQQKDTLLAQVARMLRLSETEERNVREFKRIVAEVAEEDCEYIKGFSGRVFRSPTLFEDMVKCILLCNCQWPRTLSMATALCELQWELQHCPSRILVAEAETQHFIPKTPAGKESTKRKRNVSKVATKLTSKIAEMKAGSGEDMASELDSVGIRKDNLKPSFLQDEIENDSSCFVSDLQCSEGREPSAFDRIGNFPNPKELAQLDENFLAKRCNLGYRAGRILKLAQGIVEGRIQLRELENVCNKASLTTYDKLVEKLNRIDGFGPFTSFNVLVCMGFYHVIPTDSETIRHLKQVRARKSTTKTVQMDVEAIYGKYAPFQFLAYWSELWHYYENRFGKLSEMPYSDYKLITACNMRIKKKKVVELR